MNKRYFSSFPGDKGNSTKDKVNEVTIPMPKPSKILFEYPEIPDAPELEIEESPRSHWIKSLTFWGWLIPALLTAIQAWPIIEGWLSQKKQVVQLAHDTAHHPQSSLLPKTSDQAQAAQQPSLDAAPHEQHPAASLKTLQQQILKQEQVKTSTLLDINSSATKPVRN